MTDDRRSRLVQAPDGRTLCVAEWGAPDGVPLFMLHGTPGTRLNRAPTEAIYLELGARVITYDRPGYGRSDRQRGRSIVDCVADVTAIAEDLGIDRFLVQGGSGGGPHCLAVAAGLPERVIRARCVVGVAPFDAVGLSFFTDMDPMNVTEFSWGLEGEDRLAVELTRELAEMGRRVSEDPANLLGDAWSVDEADCQVLARPDVGAVMREATAELVAGGHWGWVDDDLAFLRPWGFDPTTIRVPVEVRYGMKDTLVPAAHGAWLGGHVPDARVIVESGEGHMTDPDRLVEQMRWLVTGS